MAEFDAVNHDNSPTFARKPVAGGRERGKTGKAQAGRRRASAYKMVQLADLILDLERAVEAEGGKQAGGAGQAGTG